MCKCLARRRYHKRVDVRKPTLRFSEFQDAFLELAPHYYHYEGDNYDDTPAIITPDMSTDPELTVAPGPSTGEDLRGNDDEPDDTGNTAVADDGELTTIRGASGHLRTSARPKPPCTAIIEAMQTTLSFPCTQNLWSHVSSVHVNDSTTRRSSTHHLQCQGLL